MFAARRDQRPNESGAIHQFRQLGKLVRVVDGAAGRGGFLPEGLENLPLPDLIEVSGTRWRKVVTMNTRREHDLLGDRDVPADAYYGVHTLRAVENFPISGTPISIYPDLIAALASIKLAAARSNRDLGLLDEMRAEAIVAAAEEIRAGRLHQEFVVDVIQGGAGTSTNMNANEVIANRALELLGRAKGDYHFLHPNEHVNMSQSTNDVYPTALKLAAYAGIMALVEAMAVLRQAFEVKSEEFKDVIKMGRTQLQDAVPMTLGQEFSTYAVMLEEDEQRLKEAVLLVCEINMGATAIGTGINSHPDYAGLVCQHLRTTTGIPVVTAANLVEATQDCGSFVQLSGVLKRVAVKLSKTCNDLRLLSSGPRVGLNEINLPSMQAGSSIMPGKVNPVIPEVVNQIAFEVIGNDVTVTFAAEAGQLQLNAFEPIIAHSLFKSVTHLRAGCLTLASRCVSGITANREHLRRGVENSIGIVTALNPYIGYANATEIAMEALVSNQSVYDLVLARKLLTPEQLDYILQPEVLTRPRVFDAGSAPAKNQAVGQSHVD
jgi:aspartate ammonia-lyase